MLNSVRLTLSSPSKSFVHTILGESMVKIGRSLNCEFSVPFEDLSREHCIVEVRDEKIYVTDLGSKNGISVDRIVIQPNTMVEITPESLVIIANLYTLSVSRMEVRSKTEIGLASRENTGSHKVAEDKETVTFQLEFPDQVERAYLPKTPPKKFVPKRPDPETKDDYYEAIKMIVGFAIVALIIAYHFSKTN